GSEVAGGGETAPLTSSHFWRQSDKSGGLGAETPIRVNPSLWIVLQGAGQSGSADGGFFRRRACMSSQPHRAVAPGRRSSDPQCNKTHRDRFAGNARPFRSN